MALQFKQKPLIGHTYDLPTETALPVIVPDAPFDPWDGMTTWVNVFIKQNPGMLFGYEKDGEFYRVREMHHHSRGFIAVIILDANGRERKRVIPAHTEFRVFLGVEKS